MPKKKPTEPARRQARRLSHVDPDGRVSMVDVSAKDTTRREAVADAEVRMSAEAVAAIRDRQIRKGDPLQAARLAGIMAAKRTSELIPLCHQVPLSTVEVDLEPRPQGYRIVARAVTVAQTGVEMEALVAASVAALTLYDMLKAVDRAIVIGPIRLREKSGGRSGRYRRG
jgi:cyclic pyranopterin phosphate synthase